MRRWLPPSWLGPRDGRGEGFPWRPGRCPTGAPEGPERFARSTVGTGAERLASKRLQPVQPGGLMEIVVRGRNVEVPDHFRQHVWDKVTTLARFDGKLKTLRIDVELSHEKTPRQSAS